MKRIYIGSDHAGFSVKEKLKEELGDKYELTDLGCFSEDPCDYPDIAREVAEKVSDNKESVGILICGTGTGMAMTANKLIGVRAAVCNNEELASAARRHNNANVLALGARNNTEEELVKIADVFLSTEFETNEERHVRRVNKIDGL